MSEIFTKFHYVPETDTTAIERVQDCSDILKYTSEQRATGRVGSSDFRHAARIPDVVVEAYLNATGISFEEFVSNTEHAKRMLNDPDLKLCRVWEGQA